MSNVNKVFEFDGVLGVQIVGQGVVRLCRSISNGAFYPMTNQEGDIVEFSGSSDEEVVFNSEITNELSGCRFKWEAEGEHSFDIVTTGKRVTVR